MTSPRPFLEVKLEWLQQLSCDKKLSDNARSARASRPFSAQSGNSKTRNGSRFGTPSGVTLAPEGGAHQSIGQQLIGMSLDGLASFEPAYVDELSIIMDWSFDYMQREGKGQHDARTWLRDEAGGSVYLRLTTRPLEQPAHRDSKAFRQGVVDGAYWRREPHPNTSLVLARAVLRRKC